MEFGVDVMCSQDPPTVDGLRDRLQSLGDLWPTQAVFGRAWSEHKHGRLLSLAREAESKGHNWRPEKPVKIGCAVLGYSQGDLDLESVGWNNTPRPLTDAEKRRFKPCAEKAGIIHCLSRMLMPVGLVISTQHNQPDDDTGLLLDVFTCCSNCAQWMEVLLPPWFMIGSFCVRPDGSQKYDEWNLSQLVLLHQEALLLRAFR